jgi:hypothetical protein
MMEMPYKKGKHAAVAGPQGADAALRRNCAGAADSLAPAPPVPHLILHIPCAGSCALTHGHCRVGALEEEEPTHL